MWTRKELKTKAKASFKMNYWKTVLIALLVIALGGGSGVTASFSGASGAAAAGATSGAMQPSSVEYADASDFDELMSSGDETADIDTLPTIVSQQSESADDVAAPYTEDSSSMGPVVGGALLTAVVVLLLVVIGLAIAISAFIINPIEVGTSRYFLRNLNSQAEVSEVGYAFDNNYREGVKTMFFRDLYTALWSLLFVIPGIVKSYEYRMIPYLLADDPAMTKAQAFAESKNMMRGNKWRAFVLDLSFFGWSLLSVFTLGILTIFYVKPYKCMTDAALYESLRYGTGLPAATTGPKHAAGKHAAQVPVSPLAAEE